MMKFYADLTELNERDVSPSALKRLRLITCLSLPLTPLIGMLESDFLFDTALAVPLWILFAISLVAMTLLAFSKLGNRVWVRDKYLNDWELRMKHRSLAFALQIIVWTVVVLLFAGVFFDMVRLHLVPKITPLIVGYAAFSILMMSVYAQVFTQLAIVESLGEDEVAYLDDHQFTPGHSGRKAGAKQ